MGCNSSWRAIMSRWYSQGRESWPQFCEIKTWSFAQPQAKGIGSLILVQGNESDLKQILFQFTFRSSLVPGIWKTFSWAEFSWIVYLVRKVITSSHPCDDKTYTCYFSSRFLSFKLCDDCARMTIPGGDYKLPLTVIIYLPPPVADIPCGRSICVLIHEAVKTAGRTKLAGMAHLTFHHQQLGADGVFQSELL